MTVLYRASCVAGLLVLFLVGVSARATLVVGGWDEARGGEGSLETGLVGLEELLQLTWPCASVTWTNEITPEYLSTIDVLFITSYTSCCTVISPVLLPSEQSAILDFVTNGGSAVLVGDNDTHPGSEEANESLMDVFGLDIVGTANGLTATTDATHPIVNGPFGVIPTLPLQVTGWFDNLGPYAQAVATADINGEDILAAIELGAIAVGSGGIVLSADGTMWAPANSNYWGNVIAFLRGLGACEPGSVEETIAPTFSLSVTPNPSSGRISCDLVLSKPGDVRLKIYDTVGRLVATLQDGPLGAATHSFTWRGEGVTRSRRLPGSVYFYRLTVADRRQKGTIVLVR